MKIVALQKPISGIIFDIDQTLYRNTDYYSSQKRLLIEQLARTWQKPYSITLKMIEAYKQKYADEHAGNEPSLSKTLYHFGIDFQQNILWRKEFFKPENYLNYDKELFITLAILANKCLITAVTNNPVDIARRTLKALGIDEFFLAVFGVDNSGVSKPHMLPFKKAAGAMHKPYHELVSVGDRIAVDIDLPVQAGMNGILVESLEDVYRLPEVL